MARRDGDRVRLLTRNGNDFSRRFSLAAAAVAALPARSCLIDGEAIVTDQKGLAVFDLIRGHQPSAAAVLCAFGLLELDGEDLRREPIETRKSTLRSLLRGKHAGIAFQRALHRGWLNRLPAGLRARLRGYRLEAPRLALSLSLGVRQLTRNVYVNKLNAGSRLCTLESKVIKCTWSSLSLLR
jgi:hypothetical protein